MFWILIPNFSVLSYNQRFQQHLLFIFYEVPMNIHCTWNQSTNGKNGLKILTIIIPVKTNLTVCLQTFQTSSATVVGIHYQPQTPSLPHWYYSGGSWNQALLICTVSTFLIINQNVSYACWNIFLVAQCKPNLFVTPVSSRLSHL